MRLIHTKPPLKLREFAENEIPKYGILSHRWEKEEINFQEIMSPDTNTKNKAGYQKIEKFCARALADGLEYAWVDTCGMNKQSSAELSEAINSMFRWYQGAEVCYAYLSDVHDGNIEESAWFTRGWTLQELLAPREVLFLASYWSDLGDRSTLSNRLAKITGIDEGILTGSSRMQVVSIAKRMSWAAQRQTTRTEDIAYCLMGIFDVNMPLLYGEGQKAFIRLQEEIMKNSDDQILFAWDNDEVSENRPSGFLASSPKDFGTSGKFVTYPFARSGTPFASTNRGIRMHLPLLPLGRAETMLVLECHSGNGLIEIGISVNINKSKPEEQWVRVEKYCKRDIPLHRLTGAVLDTIYIAKALSGPSIFVRGRRLGKRARFDPKAAPPWHVPSRGHHKKLVLCFSAGLTSLTEDKSHSLISEIYRMLDKTENHQLCYYQDGTLETSPKDFVDGGYNFLMENYESGDEIYIFGFSNGACAAIILVDFVSWFHILETHYKEKLPIMWELYRNWTKSSSDPGLAHRSLYPHGAFPRQFMSTIH